MGDQFRPNHGGGFIVYKRIFSNRSKVEAFVVQRGKQELLRLYQDRLLHTADLPLVEAWLANDEQRERSEAAANVAAIESERLELERRNTAAAERSAEAAKQSARWAGWAITMSLLAVVVSVATLLYTRT